MRLAFTARALGDLRRLHDFIAERDPGAGGRVREQLVSTMESLAELPMSGRSVSELPVRQWVVGEYVARYVVHGETVTVVRIWYGREAR